MIARKAVGMPLTGPDRLEFVPALGRPMRMGSPEELLVSDADRVRQALARRDLEMLQNYWGYISFGHQIMLSIAHEWAVGWREWAGPQAAAGLAVFEETLDASDTADPLAVPVSEPDRVIPAAAAGDWETASAEFELAFARSRHTHDMLFRFSWAIMGVLPDESVQAGLTHVLTSCSFYEASWAQGQQLTPVQMAVYLAEHLRLHFSGPDREGSVQIIEEEDCFRLVVDPCGSGGRCAGGCASGLDSSCWPKRRP